jgi:hypothetical protein
MILANNEVFYELLTDKLLLDRVKLENFMLVALGRRLCSQTTIPADLPSVAIMGAAIDADARLAISQVQLTTDLRKKIKVINNAKRIMAAGFEKHVGASEEFLALNNWTKRLDLHVYQVMVRPTVHELYIYRDKETLHQLQKLVSERGQLRATALKTPNPSHGELQLAYPEEFNPQWILQMGRLLGYPECCSTRYAEDRVLGVNAEQRAATQLLDAGEGDPYAYFTSYFFPCSPLCPNAKANGKQNYTTLKAMIPEIGEAYLASMRENMDRVRRQPELIGDYLRKIRG